MEGKLRDAGAGGVSVDTAIVGVRIADGTYVPVLESSSNRRRRLVLTTVREGQTSVHVGLFKDVDESFSNPQFIGNLSVDNIPPAESGSADVTLVLGTDELGNINATLTDVQTGEYQSLSASLDESEPISDPGDESDFDLSDQDLSFDDELSLDDDLSLDDLSFEEGTLDDAVPETAAPDAPAGEDEVLDANDLPGLEEFSEESIGFDDSFMEADQPSDAIDADQSTDDEFSLDDDDLSLDDLDFGDEDGSLDDDTGDVFAEEPVLDEPLSANEQPEGMVEADLGDEDFSFDEESFAELAGEPDDALDDGLDDEAPEEVAPDGAPIIDDTISDDEFRQMDTSPAEAVVTPRKSNALIFVGYLILSLAALGVATYLVFRLLEGDPAPPLSATLAPLTFGFTRRSRRRRDRHS